MKTLNKSQRVNGEKQAVSAQMWMNPYKKKAQAFVYTTAFVMGIYTWTKFRDI